MDHMCFDIDDTITYAPNFFSRLIRLFSPQKVSIISFRTDRDETVRYLAENDIRYDELILSTDENFGKSDSQTLVEWKSGLVNKIAPDVFFEDMPEVIARIQPWIVVFMPCDEFVRGWMGEAVKTA